MEMVHKRTTVLVKTGMLAAIATVLMFIEFPLPLFPAFLKMDLSEVPALLGSFALGPMVGVLIELIKNVLHIAIKGTTTAGVGELANFLVGSALVATAGVMYQKHKTRHVAVMSMMLGTLFMTVLGCLFNYFVLLPLYQTMMGIPMDAIVKMGSEVNSLIVNVKTLVLFGIAPFNILKGLVVSLITLLVYKRLSPILHN
ncbi:MAG: ECF transporter S component [Clostridiales bacterium]|nr:ECF transporter S component [Clostridiales bacterium]